MLYRYYRNGIRITIDAYTKKAADGRYHQVCKDFAKDIRAGNRTTPRPKRTVRKPLLSRTIDKLNAFDTGFERGFRGFVRLSKAQRRNLLGKAGQAARAGLVAGHTAS